MLTQVGRLPATRTSCSGNYYWWKNQNNERVEGRQGEFMFKRAVYVLAALVIAACGRGEQVKSPADRYVVELTALDYAIVAPDSIPQGWTTFRLRNAGEQEHFVVIWPLPEGRTFDDYLEQILAPFEVTSHAYHAGELDRAGLMAGLGEALPDWAGELLTGRGGPGLTAPRRTSQTTVRLEPGDYVLECYVRAPDGNYHSMMGMVRPLTVTTESQQAPEPEADITLKLSNYAIEGAGTIAAGEYTVRVDVAENPEGLLRHDLHLARLDADGDIEAAVAWMDWVDAMQAPAPVEFLGGVEQLPAGSSGFLHVELEPGRYLWISEEYAPRGMYREFTVE